MSRLEKFIKNNRNELDDAAPPDAVWLKIEASLTPTKSKLIPIKPWVKWAAAAAILIFVYTISVLVTNKKNTSANVSVKLTDTAATDIAALAPEEAISMKQFAKVITLKQEELKTLAMEQPELYKKFSKDIDQLDSSYNTLKNKLSITPNREMLIEAMIQNLQLQLNVLNQQLNIIHQIKQSKSNNHEKDKSFI
jgi:hypothetical protein